MATMSICKSKKKKCNFIFSNNNLLRYVRLCALQAGFEARERIPTGHHQVETNRTRNKRAKNSEKGKKTRYRPGKDLESVSEHTRPDSSSTTTFLPSTTVSETAGVRK